MEFTITIPDQHINRIRNAFRQFNSETGTVGPATLAQMEAIIKAFLRSKVRETESLEAAREKGETIDAETW